MLVSLVIPVYNVENYIKECIDSAIRQTYKNMEIILVDDGSTDNSGFICDWYRDEDERVKVVHQKNCGLSGARNTGIDMATGRYLAFLDSDDYFDDTMIETLVDVAEKMNADIVCCDYSSDYTHNSKKYLVETLEKEMAIARLLDYQGYKCYAWNKLYRKELFSQIRYPIGKLFEDIPTTYKLFEMANKIVYVHETLCYYRIRENSITRTKFSVSNYDLLYSINFVMENVKNKYPTAYSRMITGYMLYYLTFVKGALVAGENIEKEILKLLDCIHVNRNQIVKNMNISFATKVELFIISICPDLFKKLYLMKVHYIL